MSVGALQNEADVERFMQKVMDLDPRLRPARSPSVVTALPPNPKNGQVVYFLADATNGIVWTLKYRANSASAYKWEFVGGPRLYSKIGDKDTSRTTTSLTYVALGDTPSITVPLAGDYYITLEAILYPTTTAWVHLCPADDGVALGDAYAIEAYGGGGYYAQSFTSRANAVGAGSVMTTMAKADGGTLDRRTATMSITPVRVA